MILAQKKETYDFYIDSGRASQVEAKIETKGYLKNPRKSFLIIFSGEFEKNNFENFQKIFEFFFKIRNFQMHSNNNICTVNERGKNSKNFGWKNT